MIQEHCDIVAPTLCVYQENLVTAQNKGSILFFHGLGSSKDQQKTELYSLAERGFLAIGIDNIGHGERRYPDFEKRFASDNPQFGNELLQAVNQTAQETAYLIEAYIQKGIILADKIGLIGVSMGGYIAYAALLAERRIKAASVILGSPYWWEADFDSPHQHLEGFFPCAILSQNAGLDQSVPAHYARDFHRHLSPYYQSAPERQHYIEYPESGHFMREQDWHQCWGNSLDWLERFV